jgi:hypothetical protein
MGWHLDQLGGEIKDSHEGCCNSTLREVLEHLRKGLDLCKELQRKRRV